MSFSGSGKNGLKTGANWGSTILFDPHSDESRGTVHKINDDSLIEDMSDLIDASEMIKWIWVYKHPLFSLAIYSTFPLPSVCSDRNKHMVVVHWKKQRAYPHSKEQTIIIG